MRSECEDL